MSLWSRFRALLGDAPATEPEPRDDAAAVQSGLPEDTGGKPDETGVDPHSTTGTSPNDTFVGRAGGDDAGYLETGAEKRAEDERD
ncbi:hypothetical protein [Nocardioides antri]|uniref:Uncharacterized protein n=1 Tax=Nocardioides antri TaxID=2607659 RepID=A0A5B1LYD0_9ACTN|nr:hypothetical protein [Nocardioides antri]KAA1425663.1 hypothetical protein F0U47_17925 [Nocardioides antri]